jgi:hypothetical protein
MHLLDMDQGDHEPRSLFEVMMAMTAEQWDALGLDADLERDDEQPGAI